MNEPLALNVTETPWSIRGSYISLATRAGHSGRLTPGYDVYLTSHLRESGRPLFAIRPLPDGAVLGEPSGFHKTPALTTVSANEASLQWTYQGAVVARATYQDVRCLRLRGTVPLALDSDLAVDRDICSAYLYTYPPSQDRSPTMEYVLNTMKGYRFIATKGQLSHVNGSQPDPDLPKRINIQASQGEDEWEILICEVETEGNNLSIPALDTCDTLINMARNTSFEDVVGSIHEAVDDFAAKLFPHSTPAPSKAEKKASYIIWMSMVRPGGKFTRECILMSKLWMNKIWSWDNCINAVGVAPASLDMAIDQVMQLFDYQAPDGRLPDSVDWLCVEWAFTKPPIQGWTIRELIDNHGLLESKISTIRRLYDHTYKFTEFWLNRRTEHSALPWYSHGNDSGWDNSTAFDGRSVIVAPDLAAFLIIQLDVLERLALHISVKSHAGRWNAIKVSLIEALVRELWDGDSFRMKDALSGETRASTSLLRLMPLTAAQYLPKEIVAKMVTHLDKHLTQWGLATEEIDSSLYEADGYWRGPIWAPSTLLIESGLRSAGYMVEANTIRERFISLCENSDFAENYDAISGEGLRDRSYTWTASAFAAFSNAMHKPIGRHRL